MKRYTYYVSYACKDGYGCARVVKPYKITTFEQIKKITEEIEALECKDVVILNYKRLRG